MPTGQEGGARHGERRRIEFRVHVDENVDIRMAQSLHEAANLLRILVDEK